MRQSAVSFKVKGLSFEGVVAQPEDAVSIPGIVVCHPHPLVGGNMDNNVVLSLCSALATAGFVTLRFNFRGVGNSEGEHSKGVLEQHEVLGALELLKAWPGVDGRRLGLAGYSFGSSVILSNSALHKKASAFALISPPLAALEGTELKKNKQPALVVAGDRDKLVQSERLAEVLETFSRPPVCQIVSGSDHYWFGYEDQLAPRVVDFFAEAIK